MQPEVEAWTAVMLEWPAGVKDRLATPYTVEFPDTGAGAGENEEGGEGAAVESKQGARLVAEVQAAVERQ